VGRKKKVVLAHLSPVGAIFSKEEIDPFHRPHLATTRGGGGKRVFMSKKRGVVPRGVRHFRGKGEEAFLLLPRKGERKKGKSHLTEVGGERVERRENRNKREKRRGARIRERT